MQNKNNQVTFLADYSARVLNGLSELKINAPKPVLFTGDLVGQKLNHLRQLVNYNHEQTSIINFNERKLK